MALLCDEEGEPAVRVVEAGARAGEHADDDDDEDAIDPDAPGEASGLVDLEARLVLHADAREEWRQMFSEAWAATVRHAHPSAVANLDSHAVLRAYAPLLEHVGCAGELRDLLGEMMAELGASHAYLEPPEPSGAPTCDQGFLGADVVWDGGAGAWRVRRLLRGDAWDTLGAAPLGAPATGAVEGVLLRAVNGVQLTRLGP